MTDIPPFVSVIVPVYNDARRIAGCVAALLAQEYPRDRYEVIVVDNGSDDGTPEVVARYPVTLLAETAARGSYAARNAGLRHARGEVLAFTDSDCTPCPRWLAEGVAALQGGADLAGGNVRFVFSARPSGAEVCDSIANMQIERNIRERGVAKTANLFVRAAVMAAVGPFPAELQSGGDVIWTGRATRQGFRLAYAPAAEVAHPTRRLAELLKKHYRVGRGQRAIRAAERAASVQPSGAAPSRPRGGKIIRTLRGFLPEPIASVAASLRRSGVEDITGIHRVWAAAWLCRAATTLGSLSASGAQHTKGARSYAAE